jgi:peptidylamidoglycolate lyase
MRLRRALYFLIVLVLFFLAFYFYTAQKKKGRGADTSVKYELVSDWPQLPGNFILGNPTGIGVDTSQNIVVFHRAEREWPLVGSMPETTISAATILVLDRKTGQLLNSWGDSLFIMPHGLTVDEDNNVWVTDVGLHQVFKFSNYGKLLMKLGEAKVAGNDLQHFDKPTDVAVNNDGSFYVSDGYGNNRIIKFSREGKYLFEWGQNGSGEGEFDILHGITLDEKKNVYVADRGNERVQVFDSTGKFLKQWKEDSFGEMCSIVYDERSKKLVAVDDARNLKLMHLGSDVIVFDSAGVVQSRFGRSGDYDGSKCWYHDVTVDKDGNVYVGDILGNRLQKFQLSEKGK